MPDTRGLRARLEAYYTAYYRDVLGIPGWADLLSARLDDAPTERAHLSRLESALGRPVSGRILNVGCGTGGFNVVLERDGARVWGIDASDEATTIAARRVAPGRIVRAVGEALPYRDGVFDLVYCFSTLEHVDDAAGVLREMVRVLRVGGALYVHTPNRWSCFESHYKIAWPPGVSGAVGRAYLKMRGRPTAFLGTLRLLALSDCRRMVERAGARIVRVLNRDVDRRVGGPVWPLVRLYYAIWHIHPYVEIVAVKEPAR